MKVELCAACKAQIEIQMKNDESVTGITICEFCLDIFKVVGPRTKYCPTCGRRLSNVNDV